MYGSHKKHSAGARNVKARAKRALLLPSTKIANVSLMPFSAKKHFVGFYIQRRIQTQVEGGGATWRGGTKNKVERECTEGA